MAAGGVNREPDERLPVDPERELAEVDVVDDEGKLVESLSVIVVPVSLVPVFDGSSMGVP